MYQPGWTKENRLLLIFATGLLLLAALAWGLFGLFGAELIRASYEGEGWARLGRLMRVHSVNNPDHASAEYYVNLAGGAIRRMFGTALVLYLVMLVMLGTRPSVFRDFFMAAEAPTNLAVFRIVLFFVIFSAIRIEVAVHYSQLPPDTRFSPPLMGWLYGHVPVNETWAAWAVRLMQATCLAALIGLWSRTSALLTAVLGVYVFALPELYGKISHGLHHVVWFAAVLGVSRCGDTLSVDALVRAWRRAVHGHTAPPPPSRAYALPLRFVWLLFGVLYFFTGFWKYVISGADWALSDNLKYKMYGTWQKLGEIPGFRLDQHPSLYKTAAVLTILFELFFIALIFYPRVRPLLALTGIAFHKSLDYFMGIGAHTLQTCYVAFFNWHRIFHRIGRRLFKSEQVARFDEANVWVCRIVAGLRVFDILGRITYSSVRAPSMAALQVTARGRPWTNAAAYRRLLIRLPLLWPFWPLLAVWAHYAFDRYRPVEPEASLEPSPRLQVRPVLAMGIFLVAINSLFGVALISSWPFSVYPTHAGISGPYVESIEVQVRDASGATRATDLAFDANATRVQGLIRRLLATRDPARQRTLLEALTRSWETAHPEAIDAVSMQFYRVKLGKAPDDWGRNPVSRELMLEVPLTPATEPDRLQPR